MSKHRFMVKLLQPQGIHQRVDIWANGALAGRLTMTPEEAEEFQRRLYAGNGQSVVACSHCGLMLVRELAEVGADGEKLYHRACWKIVSHEGEPRPNYSASSDNEEG